MSNTKKRLTESSSFSLYDDEEEILNSSCKKACTENNKNTQSELSKNENLLVSNNLRNSFFFIKIFLFIYKN